MDLPDEINGMRVIRHGVLDLPHESADDAGLHEDCSTRRVRYVAICRASSPKGYCTAFCADDWQVIASEFSQTLSRAASVAETRYAENLQWCFWENDLIQLLGFGQKWIAYSAIALVLLTLMAFLMPAPPSLLAFGILASVIAFVVATLIIWFVVARVAVASGGWLYGVLHLLLTVLFTPWLLGLFIVPAIVMGDLNRWRKWDETQFEREDLGKQPETDPDT